MPDDIKKVVDDAMNAIDELRKTSEENEKRRDVLLEDKMDRINAGLDKFEDLNQQVTLAQQASDEVTERLDQFEIAANRPSANGPSNEDVEYRNAFDRVVRRVPDDRDPDDMQVIKNRQAALTVGEDSGAGYLVAPPDMQAEIIKDIVEMTPMRSLATVRTIGGPSLKQPKRTGTGSATRVGEVTKRTNTGDPSYGMIDIPAPEMFARIEVSQMMLEDSEYDLLAELRQDSSEQFGKREGLEYISGTGGTNQAEGILVNTDVGQTISGDANALTGDGIVTAFHDIKTDYARNAVWGLNRKTIGSIRTLKDGQGNYVWQAGIAGAVPNTILGQSYVEMPDMPNEGAGNVPMVIGDFRRGYVIVDRIMISFQVDYTTGADDGLVVFRARKRTGGGVRQAEAIRKLVCST